MKIPPPDAFILNLKMISNDVWQLQQIAERASNSSENNIDYDLGVDIRNDLEKIREKIAKRLDRS